jgi:hypothetical protein
LDQCVFQSWPARVYPHVFTFEKYSNLPRSIFGLREARIQCIFTDRALRFEITVHIHIQMSLGRGKHVTSLCDGIYMGTPDLTLNSSWLLCSSVRECSMADWRSNSRQLGRNHDSTRRSLTRRKLISCEQTTPQRATSPPAPVRTNLCCQK